jgi:hypothetical protein
LGAIEGVADRLAGPRSVGNVIASGVAGLLWTAFSPAVAFAFAAKFMAVALVALIVGPRDVVRR